MRVLIFVTHLLGTGHLSRALTLGRAFSRAGYAVDVISGGGAVANLDTSGITLHQLPPVKSDGVNFTTLLNDQNTPVDVDYLQIRQRLACQILRDTKPDIVITELFPFGRRVLKAEFIALLETAKTLPKKPLVFCSIRDILAPPSGPQKAQATDELIAQYYSAVLVHSNPENTTLETSWPVTPALAQKLEYTGYVAPEMPAPHPQNIGAGEVLVTAGGGNVGEALFNIAVETAKLDTNKKWRLLVGGTNAIAQISRLQERAETTDIVIEPTRPDFRQMLHHANAAVAMCGYNTAMDLLQTGLPAVFIPFDEGGEQEQTLRATSLTKYPQFAMIRSSALTPERLLTALTTITRQPPPPHNQFDGANEAVRIISKRWEAAQ